jgi:hypothetical protein
VINDPVLGRNPEVHRWISNLPYVMGASKGWSQTVRVLSCYALPAKLPTNVLEIVVERPL